MDIATGCKYRLSRIPSRSGIQYRNGPKSPVPGDSSIRPSSGEKCGDESGDNLTQAGMSGADVMCCKESGQVSTDTL